MLKKHEISLSYVYMKWNMKTDSIVPSLPYLQTRILNPRDVQFQLFYDQVTRLQNWKESLDFLLCYFLLPI